MAFVLKRYVFTAAAVATVFLFTSFAGAQMNNKPYAFKNSPGGMGMSDGGRQAILNEKILGETPSNMLRGPDGLLLDVIKGPGNVVIVRREGDGGFVPNFRGADFRGGNADMQAGVFNQYFSPVYLNNSYSVYDNYQTSAVIGAWIAAVTPGFSYNPGNSISSWTVFVYSMD